MSTAPLDLVIAPTEPPACLTEPPACMWTNMADAVRAHAQEPTRTGVHWCFGDFDVALVTR
jgi:hypothetical protein